MADDMVASLDLLNPDYKAAKERLAQAENALSKLRARLEHANLSPADADGLRSTIREVEKRVNERKGDVGYYAGIQATCMLQVKDLLAGLARYQGYLDREQRRLKREVRKKDMNDTDDNVSGQFVELLNSRLSVLKLIR